MQNKQSRFRRIIKTLSSLRIAVIVIILMAIVSAVGTFVEAKLGLEHAQKLVYRSPWMTAVFCIFIVNLIAVIIDRWPWQKKHASFIFAHVGIIFIVLGQWASNQFGLDGTMRVPVSGSSQQVMINDTEVMIFSSFDAQKYTRLYQQNVDFIRNPPTEAKPLSFKIENDSFKFVDYKPFAIPKRELTPSADARDGKAVRIQLKNPTIQQAQMIEWLFQRSARLTDSLELGPLTVALGPMKNEMLSRNVLNFEFQDDGRLLVTAYAKQNPEPIKRWFLAEGESAQLPWMGFELQILRALPQARESIELNFKEGPTELTQPAVKIEYKGQSQWVMLNDTLKLFSENAVYIVTYGQKRIDLKFPIFLKEFIMEKYQGTNRAMEYKSIISVPGDIDSHVISMNEPLKHKGLTFYQASFQNDQMGRPVATILSVNYDPGRFLKYFGSLVMTLGVILLFYFKRSSLWASPSKD